MKLIVKTAIAGLLTAGLFATPAMAQDANAGLGEALMAYDGSGPEAGVEAPTGWHICDVVRTGAGWGNHYVALTCPNGPFTNTWHLLIDNQKDAMLATALSAATSNTKVTVYIADMASGYNEVRALYLTK